MISFVPKLSHAALSRLCRTVAIFFETRKSSDLENRVVAALLRTCRRRQVRREPNQGAEADSLNNEALELQRQVLKARPHEIQNKILRLSHLPYLL